MTKMDFLARVNPIVVALEFGNKRRRDDDEEDDDDEDEEEEDATSRRTTIVTSNSKFCRKFIKRQGFLVEFISLSINHRS